MANCLQVDMRKVGHLVGRDDGIDDRGTVDLKRLADRVLQLAGLRRLESMAAAWASAAKSGLGNSMPFL
jgi:hypothetical protein